MKRPKGSDKAVVDNITKLGGNAARERLVDFFLYFPSEIDAVRAEAELLNLQFRTKVTASSFDDTWCCYAYKKMVVTTERLEDIGTWLERLAEKHNGNYDGWGTEI